mmetsp:Transcript_9788/g.26124  ORF Transcript_9788/g.26124 Transcript_9788/m.26124 type:complete len:109 (-) Transcript_9788:168-494(-)
MLKGAGFVDIKLDVKENGREIVGSWMPGTGAENYVTSAYVTATKPQGGSRRVGADDPRGKAGALALQATSCCPPGPAAQAGPYPAAKPEPEKPEAKVEPPKKKGPVAC